MWALFGYRVTCSISSLFVVISSDSFLMLIIICLFLCLLICLGPFLVWESGWWDGKEVRDGWDGLWLDDET